MRIRLRGNDSNQTVALTLLCGADMKRKAFSIRRLPFFFYRLCTDGFGVVALETKLVSARPSLSSVSASTVPSSLAITDSARARRATSNVAVAAPLPISNSSTRFRMAVGSDHTLHALVASNRK